MINQKNDLDWRTLSTSITRSLEVEHKKLENLITSMNTFVHFHI